MTPSLSTNGVSGNPGAIQNELLTREKEPSHSGSRSKAMSLGWGDGRLEGDMGLEPDGLPSPRPSNQLHMGFDPDGLPSPHPSIHPPQ